MPTDNNEFSFLEAQSGELGLGAPIPTVSRVDVATSAGTSSSLVWGADATITLLHGGGLNAHTWDETILVLDRPAIAIDLPGHGDSAWRDDFDYRAESNAVAVGEALDALAPGTAQVVVGQSLGGLTAIALAAARPELVHALVIVDVSPGLRPGDASQVRDFLAGPQVFASRNDIVEKALAAGIGSSREKLERGVELNTRVNDDGSVVFKHHLASPPEGAEPLTVDFAGLWPALQNSAVPVLLVHGSHGFLSPEVVAEFAERVPRAAIVEIEAGHNVQEQQPAALAQAIGVFIESSENANV